MSVKQISVFLENRAGALESMTAVLGENKIDMRALSLAETKDFGIVRIIVDDVYEATTVLKEAGYVHTLERMRNMPIWYSVRTIRKPPHQPRSLPECAWWIRKTSAGCEKSGFSPGLISLTVY